MSDRLTPFEAVFAEMAASRFPPIERGMTERGEDPRDRDAFLLGREAVELLHELRPDTGLGEGVSELVAFVHAAFLFWVDGQALVAIDRPSLDRLLRGAPDAWGGAELASRTYYLQLPSSRVWGEPLPGAAPEPLDGAFVGAVGDELRVVAVFGLRPGRDGFTVAQVQGPRVTHLTRPDRTALFAPRLHGSSEAGLYSLIGAEELLELCYRSRRLLGAEGARPGVQQVSVA